MYAPDVMIRHEWLLSFSFASVNTGQGDLLLLKHFWHMQKHDHRGVGSSPTLHI